MYRVEPLGTIEDDPERHRQALPRESDQVLPNDRTAPGHEEVTGWDRPPPELIQHMRERMGELAELGIEAMDD